MYGVSGVQENSARDVHVYLKGRVRVAQNSFEQLDFDGLKPLHHLILQSCHQNTALLLVHILSLS